MISQAGIQESEVTLRIRSWPFSTNLERNVIFEEVNAMNSVCVYSKELTEVPLKWDIKPSYRCRCTMDNVLLEASELVRI